MHLEIKVKFLYSMYTSVSENWWTLSDLTATDKNNACSIKSKKVHQEAILGLE